MSLQIHEPRFWDKVQKTDKCWIWTAYKTQAGYGQLAVNGNAVYAHRYSYELANGKIPDNLVIDHLCRNRACVNPAHLEVVTDAENFRRSPIHNMNRSVCKHGHPLTPDNTYVRPESRRGRDCKECKRINKQRWREAHRK